MHSLDEIAKLGRYLNGLDVIDIAFKTDHVLEVYVAVSDRQWTQGLGSLPSIDTAGMLFCYDKPTRIPFTMKDMLFDLDIAWYDSVGKMIQNGTYTAGGNNVLVCPYPFRYVLEVPAGTLPISDLKIG